MVGKGKMRRRFLASKIICSSTSFLLFILLLLSTQTILIRASEDTAVYIDPSTQTIAPGGTFTVDVYSDPSEPIKSFEFRVSFDHTLVHANSITEGNIFDGYTTFFNEGTIDNTAGTIQDIYGLIVGSGTVSTLGTFISISFTALSSSGTSTIDLSNVGVTDDSGYIPIVVTDGSVQISESNHPPIYSSISPSNGTTNIPITRTSLSLIIRDPDGDHFNYTIQTKPTIGSVSLHNAINGTKTCTISGLTYSTTYRWYINTTDGTDWVRRWYTFTTAPNPANNLPTFSSMAPSNGTTNIPISTSSISLMIRDPEGGLFNWNIITSPSIGSRSGTNEHNGTKSCPVSGLTYSTTYHWDIKCKDLLSGRWINRSYLFTTESEPANDNPPGGGGGGGSYTPPSDNGQPKQNIPPHTPNQPTGPTFIERGVTYTYSSSAYDPDSQQVRLRFNWGDGTLSNWTMFITSNTTTSSNHMWENTSAYNITVIAQDINGSNSSWSVPLQITISQAETPEEPPVLIINILSDASANQTTQFNASQSYIINGEIISFSWDFGDGTTGTGKTPIHTYNNPGQYTVILIVTDNTGKTYSKTIIVTVAAAGTQKAEQEEKQSFLIPYLPLIFIGIIIILFTILLLFFKEKITTYLSKRYMEHQQKMVKQSIQKIREITSIIEQQTPVKESPIKGKKAVIITPDIIYDKAVERKKAPIITPDIVYEKDIEKKVDDILQSRIHDKIDKMHEEIDKM
jgi:hypothetical protein